MIEYFCSNENAKVIVTDLFWRNEQINNEILKAIKEKGYTYVSLNDLGDDDENKAIGQYWHEGVSAHPSDEGMRKIAERIVAKL